MFSECGVSSRLFCMLCFGSINSHLLMPDSHLGSSQRKWFRPVCLSVVPTSKRISKLGAAYMPVLQSRCF